MISKILSAILLFAFSGNAFALIDLPSSDLDNNGGSELILTAMTRDGRSYTYDTGVKFNRIADGLSYGWLRLSTDFLSIFNDPQFVGWGVYAADSNDQPLVNTSSSYYAGSRLILSGNQSAIDNFPLFTEPDDVSHAANLINQHIVGLNNFSNVFQENEDFGEIISRDNDYTLQSLLSDPHLAAIKNSLLGVNNRFYSSEYDQIVSQHLELFLYQETGQVRGSIFGPIFNPTDVWVNYLGTLLIVDEFLVLGGMLDYYAEISPDPFAVPLPAGIWMFISALVLLFYGRNKLD